MFIFIYLLKTGSATNTETSAARSASNLFDSTVQNENENSQSQARSQDSSDSSQNRSVLHKSNVSSTSEKNNDCETRNESFSFETECQKHLEFFSASCNGQTRRFVRCKTCALYPNIVKMFIENRKIPPITTAEGTRYRKSSVEEHFKSKYHDQCNKAKIVSTTSNNQGSMDAHISQANKALANHVGKLLI